MPIIAKDTSNRVLPPPGLHNAVCVDVHDLGVEKTPWGPKEKVLLVWELGEAHPDFEGPFRVNRKYTLSLNEKASLTQDLEGWRGKGFTKEEKEGFDLENLIGVPCTLNIVHNETESGTYANVKGVMPKQKDAPALNPSDDYVRIKDREDSNEGESSKATGEAEDPSAAEDFEPDDELPF